MSPALRISASLALLLAATSVRAAPSLRTIDVDGAFSDWTEILTNPDNVTRDDDGSSGSCVDSSDRDCPVFPRAADLVRFAWTQDDTYWYFYVERVASSISQQYLFIYFDVDRDGLMQQDEPVLRVGLRGANSGVDTALLAYQPASSLGDPLVGLDGSADGWTMPGDATVTSSGNVAPGAGNAPGGSRYEGALRWQRLRVVAGAPLYFHVSLGSGTSMPDDVADNLGGWAGAGDTGWRGVSLDGPFDLAGVPGTSVRIPHHAVATGNLPSRLGLRATSSSGLDLTWWRDIDGDGVAETLLGVDALGDGVFGRAGDSLTPAGDGDGDGALDTGLLGAGSEALVEIEVPLAPNSRGLKETITVETWPTEEPATVARVADIVRSGDLTIARDESRTAGAGQVAWLAHVVSENTGRATVAGFSAFSARGWRWSFWLDPTGDRNPEDAVPLGDGDGDGRQDHALAPLQEAVIFAAAEVPPGAIAGLVETATIRVHAGNPIASTVTDRVVVGPALDLAPSHLLSAGTARFGGTGDAIYFPHRLVSGLGRSTSFRLDAACDAGWAVTLLSDPDGDGRPSDSQPLPSSIISASVGGCDFPFIVRVTVPPTGRVNDVGTITVVATSVDDARITASVTDQAVVALIRVYDDPAMLYNVSIVPDCSTVHAVATGLPPNMNHRLTWRDSSGIARRARAMLTDSTGRCSDSYLLQPDMHGAGFTAEVEGWTGGAWSRLDEANFAIGDELSGTLALDTPRVHLAAGDVDATLRLFNASFDQTISGADILLRLLSPDGTTIADASGTFVPFTGAETTSRRLVSLAPRTFQDVPLVLRGLAFPTTGPWQLLALRAGACSADVTMDQVVVTVADDEDLDGLDAATEALLGSDPRDADSDDDGLADGAEGRLDSDGDGVPDVLQCDSDGDGLPDGLESGAWEPLPDTNVAAGCFRPDADPSTTTNPRQADTDGGGVPDGVEDANGNGALDPGDIDATDAADDAALDRDGDGLTWIAERDAGSDDGDADMDDDGLIDGLDGLGDTDGDGAPDLFDCDSDDDGILDGIEAGITAPHADTATDSPCWQADADPSTTTNPDDADSDGGGVADGVEDANRDGRLSSGETLANDAADDYPGCARELPDEVTDLRVARRGADAALSWTPIVDACSLAVIQSSERLPMLRDAGVEVTSAWIDVRPLLGASLRFYLVRAESWISGRGP